MTKDEYITEVCSQALDSIAQNIVMREALKRIKAIADEQAGRNEDRHRDRFTLHRVYEIARRALGEVTNTH